MTDLDAETATRAEIDDLGVAAVAPGLAATAIILAQRLDEAEAPTAAAVVARELRATLQQLRAVAPGKTEGDALDDLAAKRAARRGA